MQATAQGLASDIVQHMRRHNMDVMTMRWPAFYEFCQRDRIKQGFLTALDGHLIQSSILLVQGGSVVAFVKDFDFAPKK